MYELNTQINKKEDKNMSKRLNIVLTSPKKGWKILRRLSVISFVSLCLYTVLHCIVLVTTMYSYLEGTIPNLFPLHVNYQMPIWEFGVLVIYMAFSALGLATIFNYLDNRSK